MKILINGKSTEFDNSLSVQDLLQRLGYRDNFVAVAVNQECVLRKNYGTHFIQASDQIEILAPMAGG